MAKFHLDDTICAIATPVGEGGLGVVRLSGEKSRAIASRVFRSPGGKSLFDFRSHTVHYGHVCDQQGKILDEVLITFFKAPHSYTKEEMVEISTHGGMRILRSVLNVLVECGARLAEPGEFTKRAFLNGRLDLTQAEAVLDLIKARTESAREQALRQLQGEFSKKIRCLKEKLLTLCAHIEAYVDFPEDDIEVFSQHEFLSQFDVLAGEIKNLLGTFQKGSILREGILTVIVGRPNVGKSSLLNVLLDRDRAIVSDLPGTTRDALEEELEIGGVLVRIVDTAGIRSHPNAIESMGIGKTREYMRQAQLFLMVLDGSETLQEEDRRIYKEVCKKKHLVVVNKVDLPQKLSLEHLKVLTKVEPSFISVQTKTGLKEFETQLGNAVLNGGLNVEGAFITKVRHKEALEKSYRALLKARDAFEKKLSLEFIAFDLRESLDRLGEIVGEIYNDDILDVIFREFCIGK